jgi:hypothetical protein
VPSGTGAASLCETALWCIIIALLALFPFCPMNFIATSWHLLEEGLVNPAHSCFVQNATSCRTKVDDNRTCIAVHHRYDDVDVGMLLLLLMMVMMMMMMTQALHDGESYELCLTTSFTGQAQRSAWESYKARWLAITLLKS